MRLTFSRPRFTIERLRTLVLIGGVVLVAAIVIFLAAGQWTRRFLSKDLPNRLGINIEQQADGVNYTQTRKGKTIFKIHAARAVTMKIGGKTLLHDVKIDLYGEDGNRADTISGSEFEYDQKEGVATAAGAVEITMMRPGEKPAITQLKPGSAKAKPKPESSSAAAPAKSGSDHGLTPALIAGQISDNEIHVKTSGLVFNQKTGVATTAQRVDFALRQGNGNSTGATYDSQHGQLILDHAVELHVERGNLQGSEGPVTVHASHAEFEHTARVCQLTQANAEYSGGQAQTAKALLHFREDGSVLELDGSGGVDLQTKTGGHVTSPTGTLQFDENNHPSHGLLQGGAQLEMMQPNRQIRGSAPTARLVFDPQGQLSLAHLEQGVLFNSRQQVTTAKGAPEQVNRTWKSQTADVAFASVESVSQKSAKIAKPASGQAEARIEPRTIHGYGGVVVTSDTGNEGAVLPSRFAADTVVAELAPGGAITSLLGTGHASFDEQTAAGVHQASSSDQIDVRFLPASQLSAKTATGSGSKGAAASSEIASILETGHVVLVQDPPASHSVRPVNSPAAEAGLRATANRADYNGQSQILHLTGTPRVRDGAMDMTADRIDFARATGDAFAHGNVRASWIGAGAQDSKLPGASLLADDHAGAGGNGPVHAIAAEAELHQSTQEVIFRTGADAGLQPRLWQAANSVTAPLIILNRQRQTLVAEGSGAANPVRTVLLSNSAAADKTSTARTGPVQNEPSQTEAGSSTPKNRQDAHSTIRVRSGDLHYSEGERVALFRGGSAGSVTAETTGAGGSTTVVSQETEVKLLPAGTHSSPAKLRAANASGNASDRSSTSIDRLTARGHVVVDWPDRRGTGEKLVYLSEDGTFTLTGTSSIPPRIVDQARGSVTGSALIYHSGDNSVTVQGDGGKTETETRSKR